MIFSTLLSRAGGYDPLPTSLREKLLPAPQSASSSSSSPDIEAEQPISGPPFALRPRRRPLLLTTVWFVCGLLGVLCVSYAAIVIFLPDAASMAIFGQHATNEAEIEWSDTIPEGYGSRNDTTADDEYEGEDLQVELVDQNHVLRPILPLGPSASLLRPISRPPRDLLVDFYATGNIPSSVPMPPQDPVDIVYMYVNASSPFLQTALRERARLEGLPTLTGKAKRWRDNGELRGAIRSAASNLADALGKIHVISGDYAVDDADLEGVDAMEGVDAVKGVEGWRVGQVPGWLDTDAHPDGMRWHFHSDVYRLPRDDDGQLPSSIRESEDRDENHWRDEAMPTFNSFAIESRLSWVDNLAEDFVMSNDDMFILTRMSRSDFHNPLLGAVLRFDPGLKVSPNMPNSLKSSPGEWGGLQHANALLSARFPARPRAYMHHMPKSLRKAWLDEASIMFAPDLTVSATRGFRESRRGDGDVEISWLVSHLGVERWREALLWTWVVAKVGGPSGVWDETARQEVKDVLGFEDETKEVAIVTKKKRSTLTDVAAGLHKHGVDAPMKTEYIFSSLDGHLPADPGAEQAGQACFFSITRCLPANFFAEPAASFSASDIFKTIAFGNPSCGDCLVSALIGASGTRGLSAVLPEAGRRYTPPEREPDMWQRGEPMLPLTPRWADTDFSLDAVVLPGQDGWGENVDAGGETEAWDGSVDLRAWSVKLLSRYTYVHASTPMHFVQASSPNQLYGAFGYIDSHPNLALVCINDDQTDRVGDRPGEMWGEWLERRFGAGTVPWEREGWAWRGMRRRRRRGLRD